MLTKPILLYSPSFDATKEKIFRYNVVGATSQVTANKLTIRRQSDNVIVYDQTQSTFKYEHTLPADTLVNGEYYNAVVSVFDNAGNESQPSSPIQFRCYTAPTLEITNLPVTGIVNNASFNFEFEYNQVEGERLNDYKVNLYTANQILISTSGNVYVQDGTPPYKASYLFAGFEDNASYYVEVVGTTVNGAVVETGKIKFDVDYRLPDLFTLLVLENNCEEGTIKIASNIVLIDGVVNPDPPVFIDGKEIDLTGDEAYVKWNQGYSFSDNFLARGWFRKPNKYSTLARFSTVAGRMIEIKYMEGYESQADADMKAYLQVSITSVPGIESFIISNYITPLSDTEYYSFQLQRIDDVYQVILEEIV